MHDETLKSAVVGAHQLSPMLINERDAARLLGGVCAKTLYNLRRSGKLPCVKIGSRMLYDVDDLRRFIDRRKGDGHA